MGAPGSKDGRMELSIGLAGTPLPVRSGPDDQVDDMVCDPANLVPSISACIAGGEENFMEPVNCGAPDEQNAGNCQLPGTSSSSEIFNNDDVDGGVRSEFSKFVSSLLGFPAGGENNFHEHRYFALAALVKFLEDRNVLVRKAASQQIADLDASHRSKVTRLTGEHEQQVTDSKALAQGQIQELSRDLKKVSNELSDALAQQRTTSSNLNSAQSEVLDRKSAVQIMQAQLDEVMIQKQELSKRRDMIQKDMSAQRSDFEDTLRHSQEARLVKDREVQRLNGVIEEKIKAAGYMKAVTSQLTSQCQKLKGQLATLEQKSALESLTSGSYPDECANPGLLVNACHGVDTAIDQLVRFLHDNSITGSCSLKTSEVESFIGMISPARLADFARPAQVKHVWGHWICGKMFEGFEHVFFNTGGDSLTSPLDSKKHAAECFQSFQLNRHVAPLEYHKACAMFRAFCIQKYSLLFPLKLVNYGLQLDTLQIVSCDRDGRFDGDGDLYSRFLITAKAVWLLHELSFSFDPPASILRMGPGTPFDNLFHEPLITESEKEISSKVVVLMLKPAFRARTSIIKSRVFLAKMSP